MRLKSHFFLGALLAITGGACSSGTQEYGKPKKHTQEQVTADDQMRGNDSDIEVTRKIRSRLTDDDVLSLSAQNITIVTLKKSVTLKGEVRNQQERDRVLEHARQFTGPRSINNQMIYTE